MSAVAALLILLLLMASAAFGALCIAIDMFVGKATARTLLALLSLTVVLVCSILLL